MDFEIFLSYFLFLLSFPQDDFHQNRSLFDPECLPRLKEVRKIGLTEKSSLLFWLQANKDGSTP